MSKLKGIIFSVEDTLLPQGTIDEAMFAEVTKLVNYLYSIDIQISVFTNRSWVVGDAKAPLEEVLKSKWGDKFTYYSRQNDAGIPAEYGFEFDTPKSIARYIDTFCLRDHLWCHEIHDNDFRFYALAPFSTMKPEYTLYSQDAKSAAKHGRGHPDFWTSALFSSLYFSGIHAEIDYITTYPGHGEGSGNSVME